MASAAWTWLRDLPYSWWDRLVASDAGLIRLQSAIRVTVAVALTFAAIDALTVETPLPKAMIVMGIIESLFASVSVRDSSPSKQRLTLLLTPLPAAAALTVGTALAPWRGAGDGCFLLVIFAATYARRYGPRASALGMLAYISYFVGIYLHLPFAQLRYQMIALGIGTVVAYVVRFALLPDRPDRTLRHVLASLYRRISQMLGEIEGALRTGAWDDRRRRRLRRRLTQINETALAAERQIEALDPTRLAPAATGSELGLRLFDLEIVAGRLARAAVRTPPPAEERMNASRIIAELRAALEAAPTNRPRETLLSASAYASKSAVMRGLGRLAAALLAMPSAESSARPGPAEPPADTETPAPGGAQGGLAPTTRAAIQVTLACALAIVPGEFLSPQRWYWAVITVFVMFSGTQSRVDVLAKGIQRAMGTLTGVVAGIVVATAVAGDYALSLALIFACVFLAYYFFQAAYGLMIFWITVLISLLYGLLGEFTPALLLLRIEETALGAFVGVLVAAVVLPTSSRETFATAARDFLLEVGKLVGRAIEPGAEDLTGQAREVDRRLHQLRAAAKPLVSGLSGAFAPSPARRWTRFFLACDYYARDLTSLAHATDATGGAQEADECRQLAARIGHNIASVAAVLEKPEAKETSHVHARTGLVFSQEGHRSPMVHALSGIDEAIWRVARDLGMTEADPAKSG